jgi:fructose-bisphosphate aldolase class II
VLHGSSGVSDESLREAVAAGMVKINIGTALNIAYTRSVRTALEDPAVIDPRSFLTEARESMAARVEHLLGVVALQK